MSSEHPSFPEGRLAADEIKAAWPLLTGSLAAAPSVTHPDVHWDWRAINSQPLIDPTAWVAPSAIILGRVKLKARSSIWYGCVLRGDQEWIEVGEETNVQDGSILHVDDGYPCILGDRVTLGHRAIVHGSVVGHGALIGISATVLSRCVIGDGALIAGGSLIREGTIVPPHTLWAGCPARQLKELTSDQRARLAATYRHYVNNSAGYAQSNPPTDYSRHTESTKEH
ncbi:MAG: gamma carbonic anhydrase family protein [Planctomycetes bacterium]|nr:gamma carbonic anhydrase family protein [Planctomycetota bacterium]